MLHFKLAFLCLLGAGGILWAVLPRIDRFQAPGPCLESEQHPRLFQEISGVAQAVDQAMPVEVYLVPEVNAWVTNRGGIMGLGSRRVMGLGLPLLQVLSVSELRAVMVHEFGHYHGGDTALAPWVYKTRSAIFRTLEQLKQSLLQKPFVWYAKLFLRLTNAVARKQEYAADALAAEVAGPGPMITGLKKLYLAGLAFETYWVSELSPLLSLGFRAPLAEGFRIFLDTPEASNSTQEALTQEMENSDTDPYDTHPCLKDRITFLEKLPVLTIPVDNLPALKLIDNLAVLERDLLVVLFGEEQARGFQEISWKDTAVRAVLPGWREMVRDHAKAFAGLRLGELPDLVEYPEEFLTYFEFPPELSLEEKQATLGIMIGGAVATALYGQGCQITKEVGEPVKVLVAGEWVEPLALMANLQGGTLTGDHWKNLCARAGLSELDLGVIKEGNEA